MSLADRLKTCRESIGKSQKEMAAILGVSFRAWQDYEAGNNVPGGKVFESLARLGFDTNWILTGKGQMKQGEIKTRDTRLPPEEAARVTRQMLDILEIDENVDYETDRHQFFEKMIMQAMPLMTPEQQEETLRWL